MERLTPYKNELRRNNACVGRMVQALETYGFRAPLLVQSDGVIVDGHLRFKAARTMGLSEIPVVLVDGLTAGQIAGLRLLFNRSATWASWDDEALARELTALDLSGFDLALTGFETKELDAYLALATMDGEPDPDAVSEPPVHPVSRHGDLWLMGEHRLLCGDATNLDDVRRVMGGDMADMVWTDPPYNVAYEGKAGAIQNDAMSGAAFEVFLENAFAGMWAALADGGAIYVAHSEAGGGLAFRQAFAGAGFKMAACLVWRKNHFVRSRGDYHWQHEPILYGWKPTGPHRWHGDRRQTTVLEGFAGLPATQVGEAEWRVTLDDMVLCITGGEVRVERCDGSVIHADRPMRSELHPTMKPVGLIERMVRNSSPRAGIVFEPFGGSGSTLVACERLGRRCRALELDPRFVDVIVERWQTVTGLAAVHEDGRAFSASKERCHGCC